MNLIHKLILNKLNDLETMHCKVQTVILPIIRISIRSVQKRNTHNRVKLTLRLLLQVSGWKNMVVEDQIFIKLGIYIIQWTPSPSKTWIDLACNYLRQGETGTSKGKVGKRAPDLACNDRLAGFTSTDGSELECL